MVDELASGQAVPESRTTAPQRIRFSVVWIIPIVAALAGAWVAVTRIMSQGPEITIQFATAEGLEAGKTKVHFNGVDVGSVTAIQLAADRRHVLLTVRMAVNTQPLLVDDTRFWVVSPRISGTNVTGLTTLISGAYIGMEIGRSKQARRAFVGLETPPIIAADIPGHFYVLKAADLGSITVGAPIYYRRLEAGQVISYELDKDGQALTVRVFVRAPYDRYVNANTRFWQASGVDVSLTAAGLTVDSQSLLSILAGGIAFENSEYATPAPEAPNDARFLLYHSRADAFRPPPGNPRPYRLVFRQTVRGLAIGAPVEFRGIPIGDVMNIEAVLDTRSFEFSSVVTVRLDMGRLGLSAGPAQREQVGQLVAHGMRAQLRSSSLLTEALYVAIDIFRDVPPARIDTNQEPIELPTIRGAFEETETRVTSIVRKIDQLPLAEIGARVNRTINDLDVTLGAAQATLKRTDALIDHANRMVEPDSVLGVQLDQTLAELRRAARELRALSDSLNRQPESFLHGRSGDPDKEKK
jgi:paraquat-inducible protein B